MIERLVIDGAPDPVALAGRLRSLGLPVALETGGDGPAVLWVVASPDAARAAVARGSRAWTVGPAGDLLRWDDLPLALALGLGTLADVRRIVGEAIASGGLALRTLAWTPDGAVSGEAERGGLGVPVYVTAGPDGEDPQIHTGGDAEAYARERAVFVRTLATGTTHSLDAPDGRRPRLARERIS